MSASVSVCNPRGDIPAVAAPYDSLDLRAVDGAYSEGCLEMADYRRWHVPGGTYFFTVVTFGRRRWLVQDTWRELLREAIEKERRKRPFRVVAWVLLPDHMHAVWTLPPGDQRYSLRWQKIKEEFTKSFLQQGGGEGVRNRSRRQRRERSVWQRRFWEHTIRDESDLERCVDYAHWNPVKHGLVRQVCDWKWSTFHRFVQVGHYGADWGRADLNEESLDSDWGEWPEVS
jgi:putative transposase